jgi:hypothetical protein
VAHAHAATRPRRDPFGHRDLLTRVLCRDDRRGIYTELTERGWALLRQARPTHDEALESVLAEAKVTPELAPLAEALHHTPFSGQELSPATDIAGRREAPAGPW